MKKKAFTLIELMVVISFVSLLVAILLPAVQSARESSRRLACSNNLRQIGLALNNYHSAVNSFPTNGTSSSPNSPKIGFRRFYSPHTRILPYIEQASVYASINYDVEYDWDIGFLVNATAYSTTIGVFLCPSDNMIDQAHACNYSGNVGVGPFYGASAETPDSGNGFFSFPAITNASSFGDGLSHTVAFSERLRGTSVSETKSTFVRSERDFNDLSPYPNATLSAVDMTLSWCLVAARDGSRGFDKAGESWFFQGREYTNYTHAQEPNGRIQDALDRRFVPSTGVSTVRSFHLDGVNAVMADASVRFVSNNIERRIWRALGTRNGSELVE